MNEKDHPAQGLSGFVRYGVATKDIRQADWTGSLGLRYHGLIDGRDDDISAIGITVSHASDTYQRLNNSLSSETSVEATYRMQVKPWCALQPAMQYVLHQNMNPARQNVCIMGARIAEPAHCLWVKPTACRRVCCAIQPHAVRLLCHWHAVPCVRVSRKDNGGRNKAWGVSKDVPNRLNASVGGFRLLCNPAQQAARYARQLFARSPLRPTNHPLRLVR